MRKNILAVDDEEDLLELVRFNLEREGYDVVCAESGEEALKKVDSSESKICCKTSGKGFSKQ